MRAQTICLVLCAFACVAARPVSDQVGSQMLVGLSDYFACRGSQEGTVLCPDGAPICKCPAGFYGALSMNPVTLVWSGICSPCPRGYWSTIGSETVAACTIVPCPEHASNHPDCECDTDATGSLHWMVCTGQYDGVCQVKEIPAAKKMAPPLLLPLPDPPVTTIFQAPDTVIPHSSAVIFFHVNTSSADTAELQYTCQLDDKDVPCQAPSVSLEKLSQGVHAFRVWATDAHGQKEAEPPVTRFEVQVPCPSHSSRTDPSIDDCTCDIDFYSPSHSSIPYADGAYSGSCSACEPCDKGYARVGCTPVNPGECVACDIGTFKTQGLEEAWNETCIACVPCPAGFIREGCGNHTDGVCTACPHGEYKTETGEWNSACAQCQACAAGFELVGCEGESNGTCSACPDGKYKDASATAWDAQCVDCQPCKKGYYRSGCGADSAGTCVACATRTYKTTGGEGTDWRETCVACQPCKQGEGGYRAQCGGPYGPGTCELCSECAGTDVEQCFCDVVVVE